MAIQKGSFDFEGQIGNLSFYKSNGKTIVRTHSGADRKRIEKDPNYARTRENNAEFGRSSHAAKLIRTAVRRALGERYAIFEDPTVVNRLTSRLSSIIKADSENAKGQRDVQPQNLHLLHGFSFNAVGALKDLLFVPPKYTCSDDSSLLEVSLPELIPHAAMAPPEGADLCSFHIAALSFNTRCEHLPFAVLHHELRPLGQQPIPEQTHELALPTTIAPDPVIICFGLSFYQKIGGFPTPIITKGKNVFEVLGVSTLE